MLFGEPKTDCMISIHLTDNGSSCKIEGGASPHEILDAMLQNYKTLCGIMLGEHAKVCQEKHCHLAALHTSIQQGITRVYEDHRHMHHEEDKA